MKEVIGNLPNYFQFTTNYFILSALNGTTGEHLIKIGTDRLSLNSYKERILNVLRSDFSDSKLFAIKDPRICRFWPLWKDVLVEFGADPKVVLPIRNPLEVASSLKHREGFLTAPSLLLWLRHVLDAESSTRGLPRAIVTYDALMQDWSAVVSSIGSQLQIGWPRKSALSDINIETFLSKPLHHHTSTLHDLTAKKEVVDWVKDAYAALRHLSVDPERKDHLARLDRVRSEFDKAAAAFGVALAAQEVKLSEKDSENAKLQEQVALSNERLRLSAEAETAAANLKQELEQARAATHDAEAVAANLKQDLEHIRAAAAREAEAVAATLKQELEQARAATHDAEAVAANLKQELGHTRAAAAHETISLTSELTSLRRRTSYLLDETRRQHAEANEAASRAKQALDEFILPNFYRTSAVG